MDLKTRIIEEASKQFLQYGIRAITMDEIAKNLGISKRTVYETFKDKDTLVSCCIDFIQESHLIKQQAIELQSENVIQTFFKMLMEGIKIMKTTNPLFFKDLQKYHHPVWKGCAKRQEEKKRDHMNAQLRKGIEQGFLRSDINPDIVTRILFEQMNILGNDEVFPPEKFDRTEVFENILVNFVRGISTMKGMQMIDELQVQYKSNELR
ncbi:TetR/AcrR family transcriptional regulator [Breznakibacter xylanolyticus]|nr:TetR/AcrR family transcriptional regulator [Breznakibacter xylanolyticus]MBN2743301.1 TetR/AcrR family transcriptional regulator [Marinilabiliaceae bacterium]